jgi:epoxyqueuosine reductase QueG
VIEVYEKLLDFFTCSPDIIFGISKYGPDKSEIDYQSVLSIAIPHSRRLGIADYREEEFEALIREARQRSIDVIHEIASILEQNGVRYFIPIPVQKNEEELEAMLSFKHEAVRAGLGWIGKNDVLITRKYGPQVSLNAILIAETLPAGEPLYESKCPPECMLCVEACPHDALVDTLWSNSAKRAELIDYQLCNRKRSIYKLSHGRKHACGLCIAACPVGRHGMFEKI